MKILRALILADTVLLATLGLGIALAHPYSFPVVYAEAKPYQEMATLRLLGTALGGLAIVLFVLSADSLVGDRRRLALWLSGANGLVAIMAFLQQTAIWGSTVGWLLVMVFLGMAVALAWAGWRPLKPEEIAAEVATLQIPGEIREGLLRQIGEAAAQEERNRLARDLHDSIKQQLFAVNVSTAAAQELWTENPEKAKAALVDVRRSAREAMVEMQALLHQLQPQALASSGLIEALREQCEALGYRTGAEVLLEVGEAIPDDRLPPGAQETLFRIAQEALSNVARHARARRVRVCLGREGDCAVFQVTDNGQGFNPQEARAGTGLRSLRERAESLHGRIEIDSAPGAGTAVKISIPLTSPPQPRLTATKALQKDWSDALLPSMAAVICFLHLIRPSESWSSTIVSCLYVVLLVRHGLSLLRRPVAEDLPGSASLNLRRFRKHRNATLSFFLAAGIAPWSWRRGELWVGWTAFWLSAALLTLGLAVFALIRLHRTSELRPRWWHPSQFRLGPVEWSVLGISVIFLGMFVVGQWELSFLPHTTPPALFQPLEPLETAFVLVGAAILLYMHTRKPRDEGTTT